MLSIPASRSNAYTGSPLDRVSDKRDDEAFVAAALADPNSLFVPVWRSRSLMRGVAEGSPEAVLLTGAAAETVRPFVEEVHIVDGGTIDCRLDPARTACAKVVEALVRSGIAVESVAFHPPWAAQLLAPRSP
jgi:hypothetical protein